MSMKKVIKVVIVAILLATILYGGKYLLDVKAYKAEMSEMTIDSVDFASLEDGVYQGSFDASLVSATVSVKVHSGNITEINLLEHKFERGKPAEAILDTVIHEQSLDVDTVTGATNSSKTILKAMENALKQPPRETE
ncbi:FMN-binding protein [Fusibacter ferrireducens]|nr:FMN-binding protein [Fusibacter ferrireducens]